MRTTINIDDPILRRLKKLQRRSQKSLGRLVSDLLAEALANEPSRKQRTVEFSWISKPMRASINLSDKCAGLDAMDDPHT